MNEEEKEKLIEEYDLLTIQDRAGYKNVIAILEFTKETRKLFRELEKENELYKNQIVDLRKKVEMLTSQVQNLLITVHQNRPTT
jgi:chaperonin cofactor prefoldin